MGPNAACPEAWDEAWAAVMAWLGELICGVAVATSKRESKRGACGQAYQVGASGRRLMLRRARHKK